MSTLNYYHCCPKIQLEHNVESRWHDPRFLVGGSRGDEYARVIIGDRAAALRFRRTLNAMLKATAPPRKRR